MDREQLQSLSSIISLADAYVSGGTEIPCTISPAVAEPQAHEAPVPQQAAGPVQHAAAPSVSIDTIARKIAGCNRCRLCERRTNTVPGMGVQNPLVLVIGEGPGQEEDRQGLPFVGPAGQLLDKMLAAIMLSRQTNCFIANIVKCRPPNNRDPLPEETQACRSFLDAQISVLKPKLILLVGRIALQNLLETQAGVSRVHGEFFEYKGIPVMPTYHPSALLRQPELKRDAWNDLKKFRSRLEEMTGRSFTTQPSGGR